MSRSFPLNGSGSYEKEGAPRLRGVQDQGIQIISRYRFSCMYVCLSISDLSLQSSSNTKYQARLILETYIKNTQCISRLQRFSTLWRNRRASSSNDFFCIIFFRSLHWMSIVSFSSVASSSISFSSSHSFRARRSCLSVLVRLGAIFFYIIYLKH